MVMATSKKAPAPAKAASPKPQAHATKTAKQWKYPFDMQKPQVFIKENNISADAIRKLSGLDDNATDAQCLACVCSKIRYGFMNEDAF